MNETTQAKINSDNFSATVGYRLFLPLFPFIFSYFFKRAFDRMTNSFVIFFEVLCIFSLLILVTLIVLCSIGWIIKMEIIHKENIKKEQREHDRMLQLSMMSFGTLIASNPNSKKSDPA